MRILVVGAGFAGSIMAERLAEKEHKVMVVDRRDHIGGNAHDYTDDHGVRVHKYGPHLFHTNSEDVWKHLSRFTDWTAYEHRVVAEVGGLYMPIPINRTTISMVARRKFETDEEVQAYLDARRLHLDRVDNSEEAVLAKVGRELYEMFFEGYTKKQWGRPAVDLDKSVCARIPVRTDDDDRYFTDRFQAIPSDGYTAMFGRILDHPNITTLLDVDARLLDRDVFDRVVWTGPIDEYFGHCFGELPYRSLAFRYGHVAMKNGQLVQPVAQVNYPDLRRAFTRSTEYRHITGGPGAYTTIQYEYPVDSGEPYYPIPAREPRALYEKYRNLGQRLSRVMFVGRLARYTYLNMDQVVAQALKSASYF